MDNIVINVPPMPKLSDFKIESAAENPNYQSRLEQEKKQIQLYNEALAAWKEACKALAQQTSK